MALVKPLPVIVTVVPPPTTPAPGDTLLTTGGPYVYWSALDVDEVPTALETVTSTVPAPSGGAMAVSDVPPAPTTTFEPGVPPNETDASGENPVPVIVTVLPPPSDPAQARRP